MLPEIVSARNGRFYTKLPQADFFIFQPRPVRRNTLRHNHLSRSSHLDSWLNIAGDCISFVFPPYFRYFSRARRVSQPYTRLRPYRAKTWAQHIVKKKASWMASCSYISVPPPSGAIGKYGSGTPWTTTPHMSAKVQATPTRPWPRPKPLKYTKSINQEPCSDSTMARPPLAICWTSLAPRCHQ